MKQSYVFAFASVAFLTAFFYRPQPKDEKSLVTGISIQKQGPAQVSGAMNMLFFTPVVFFALNANTYVATVAAATYVFGRSPEPASAVKYKAIVQDIAMRNLDNLPRQ